MDIVANIALAIIRHGVVSGSELHYNNWVLHFEDTYLFLHNNVDGIAWPYRS
jgi:hypothetical protein